MKILLIDDNQKFGKIIQGKFAQSDQVQHCVSIEAAINSSFSPEIILLDVNLGDQRAQDYLHVLNSLFPVPIIAISSDIERATKYQMFAGGVVDYIEKPIDYELLKLKIDNLKALNKVEIKFNELTLNTNNLMLNAQVKLSKNEFIILKYFMQNSEELITKKSLLRLLWENETFVEETALNTLISRLRKKINLVDNNIEIISIRNQGIKFGVKC